jgi:hypothetical protein
MGTYTSWQNEAMGSQANTQHAGGLEGHMGCY